MGFPCISVSSQQEGADRVLSLKQTKFVGDGSEGGGARWHVPISVISSAAPDSPIKVRTCDQSQASNESCDSQ